MSLIIAVSGGSGSGKSFLSHALKTNLPHKVSILSFDNYYLDQSALPMEERAKINYDDPSSLDIALFKKHLSAIKKGETIQVPQYDFATHSRKPLPLAYVPSDVVIVEGILVLALPELLPFYDYKVFVDADADVRLSRRIRRDMAERGRSLESVLTQYFASVKPAHDKFVEPGKEEADFVFLNNDNNGIDEKQMKTLLGQLLSR